MEKQATASLMKHFESLADPRTGNAKAHIFVEILIIAILAVICGAEGWSMDVLKPEDVGSPTEKNI